ncbi:hypothetical protein WICPIJ_005976 [Wickerhamomyces pijperi]|uniref:Uncharacterized protein n=1 Tax=Wickerhamomyces pijperi TaxID=599730 RepID=A0A9P8Q4Q3_WICPI|nr:hypothetical protein WICPIJ_005976 [Wickerhamomyces pijperi]
MPEIGDTPSGIFKESKSGRNTARASDWWSLPNLTTEVTKAVLEGPNAFKNNLPSNLPNIPYFSPNWKEVHPFILVTGTSYSILVFDLNLSNARALIVP